VTAAQPPAPAAVELPGPEAPVQGIAWAWPGADLAVLMVHDIGADLDSIRWLAEPVAAAGVSVLCVDLPGHGLSEGQPESAAAAIATVYQGLCRAVPGVTGVVAEGQAGSLLLSTSLDPAPVAATFIAPQPPGAAAPIASGWRFVPKLVIAPHGQDASGAYAQHILAATNAWSLRADLARAGDGNEPDPVFEQQVASLTIKFMLEPAAFELSSRRRAAMSAASQAHGEETGWIP
jgi:pimeloyl-ACP methyl ester carboxylesterase